MKKKNTIIPFTFVIDNLISLAITIKPMFGCHAIYLNEKLLLIVRKKESHVDANGIWIATDFEHHTSLKKDFPNLKSVYVLSNGKSETAWQMINELDDDFEENANLLCSFILKKDLRIGRIPKSKKRNKKTLSPKTAPKPKLMKG